MQVDLYNGRKMGWLGCTFPFSFAVIICTYLSGIKRESLRVDEQIRTRNSSAKLTWTLNIKVKSVL